MVPAGSLASLGGTEDPGAWADEVWRPFFVAADCGGDSEWVELEIETGPMVVEEPEPDVLGAPKRALAEEGPDLEFVPEGVDARVEPDPVNVPPPAVATSLANSDN